MSNLLKTRTRNEIIERYLSFLDNTLDPLHFHRFALEELTFHRLTTENIDVVQVMRSYIVDVAWPSIRKKSFNPVTINRTVVCLREWAWALNDEEAQSFLTEDVNFDPLGIPMLIFMCKKYSIEIPEDFSEC